MPRRSVIARQCPVSQEGSAWLVWRSAIATPSHNDKARREGVATPDYTGLTRFFTIIYVYTLQTRSMRSGKTVHACALTRSANGHGRPDTYTSIQCPQLGLDTCFFIAYYSISLLIFPSYSFLLPYYSPLFSERTNLQTTLLKRTPFSI